MQQLEMVKILHFNQVYDAYIQIPVFAMKGKRSEKNQVRVEMEEQQEESHFQQSFNMLISRMNYLSFFSSLFFWWGGAHDKRSCVSCELKLSSDRSLTSHYKQTGIFVPGLPSDEELMDIFKWPIRSFLSLSLLFLTII